MTNYVSNRPVTREFSDSGQARLRLEDRFFVERKEGGDWQVVAPTDRFVSMDELGAGFGLWKDQEITQGHLWWKQTVRPLDGKIDADEVVPMAKVMRQDHDSFVGYPWPNHTFRSYDHLQVNKTDLNLTTSGGTLTTDWTTMYRHETQNDWGTVNNVYLAG